MWQTMVGIKLLPETPSIAATIVGARTPGQLQGALAAGDLVLPHQIRRALDDVTAPSA